MQNDTRIAVGLAKAVFEVAVSDRPGKVARRERLPRRGRKDQPDHLREWAHKLAQTHVHNKAAVAVANKMARIVWAVWSRLEDYGHAPKAA